MMFVAKASLWRDIFRQSYAKVLLTLTFLMQISLGKSLSFFRDPFYHDFVVL